MSAPEFVLLAVVALLGFGVGIWLAGEIVKGMVLDVFEVARQQGAEAALMELERRTGFKRPRPAGPAGDAR